MAYTDYYLRQVGRGQADIGYLYKGRTTIQRGRGVGSFFANIMRYISPALKSGLNTIADQARESTSAIAKEIAFNDGKKPIGQILKEQGKVALKRLASKGVSKLSAKMQKGGSIKLRKKVGRSQCRKVRQVGGRRKLLKKKNNKWKKKKTTTIKKKKARKVKSRVIDIFNN